jgi:sulfite exporter TauE/SafE
MATTMGDEAKFEQFCDPLVEKLVEMMNEFSKELDREYEYHAKTFLGRRVTYAIMGLAFGLWIFGMVSSYLTGIENRRPINLSNLTTTSS